MAPRTHRGTAPVPRYLPVAMEDGVAAELVNSSGTPPLPWALLLWEAGRGVGSNGAIKLKPLLPNSRFFLPNPSFLPFFPWCGLLLTGSHHSPSVSTIPLSLSKSHTLVHGLILCMHAGAMYQPRSTLLLSSLLPPVQ